MRTTTVTLTAAAIATAAAMFAFALPAGDHGANRPPEDTVNESQPSVAKELANLRGRVERLELSARLESASVGQGGIRFLDESSARSEDFDGDLADNDFGTQGWAVGGQGAAVFSAIAVRDGAGTAVESDAMTDPSVSLNSITAGFTEFASVSVSVPSWATSAQVFAISSADFFNGLSGNPEWSGFSRIVIEGDEGLMSGSLLNAPDQESITAQHSRTIDVSALATVDVTAEGRRDSQGTSALSSTFIASGQLLVVVTFAV